MGIEEGNHKEPTTGERKLRTRYKRFSCWFVVFCVIAGFIVLLVWVTKEPVPKIELVSMEFTVLNITNTRLSAKWDLSIRIPNDLPGQYICLQGDIQASFMYKNVTLATSFPQKYSNLQYFQPQVLKVSAGVSGEDIDGLIVKDITEDLKEKKEVRFGTRFYLTDCRKKTNGTMKYACDDVTLRFEPGSEIKAALFGKNPSCVYY
ncbi:F202 protein [Hirschfeldia incana]|nr:F202 protein [Hirschfeldia incana]